MVGIMKTVNELNRFFILLPCLLVGTLVDSSSLSSTTHPMAVTYKVGNQAVLPCSWKSRLGELAPPTRHIQWVSLVDTVFEQQGLHKWQAVDFNGRVEVPEEKLESGDCSLIISDVQIADTGRYESFMVVDGAWSKKTRVFIQTVKLSVFDHKSSVTGAPGEDFVLDLYTSQSTRVVFQGRNSSDWLDLWMRGDENTQRLQKHPSTERLTVRKLQRSDEGLYKVLDGQGLTVSTVNLAVKETLTVHQVTGSERLTGDAARSSCSALFLLSGLVYSLQILHL